MEVRVLIVDDEESTRHAIVSLLKTEGWALDTATDARAALEKLRQGPWHLVIASTEVARLDAPLFESLQALAEAEGPLRLLFLVSIVSPPGIEQRLEQLGLPHTTKPLRVDDFLEQVSDLLVRARTIHQPLRRVKELAVAPRPLEHRVTTDQKSSMFASRKGYDDYTEEDLKEFEDEEQKRKAAQDADKPPD